MKPDNDMILMAGSYEESISGITQLKRHEGFRSKPYRDSVGVLTIGHGINIDNGIDEHEAHLLLDYRVNKLKVRLPFVINNFHELTGSRQWVLINMAYNLGLSGLLKFKKMLKALDNKDYDLASYEMLHSLWATQVGDRAEQLAGQLKEG